MSEAYDSNSIDAVISSVTDKDTFGGAGAPAENNQQQPSAPAQQQPAAPRPEAFPAEEYREELGDEFDPAKVTPEMQKLWPKKYTNALSRRDKEITKLRAELQSKGATPAQANAQAQAAVPQVQQPGQVQQPAAPGTKSILPPIAPEIQTRLDQNPNYKALLDNKPNIKDYSNYGEFLDAQSDWKVAIGMMRTEATFAHNAETAKQTEASAAADAATETKIVQQAQELISQNPELLQLVQENADVLDALPDHVTTAASQLQNPALAFMVALKTDGALAALGKMDANQALIYLAKCEAYGVQQIQGAAAQNANAQGGADAGQQAGENTKRVSAAPAPMSTVRGAASGQKQMADMNADEIEKALGGFTN